MKFKKNINTKEAIYQFFENPQSRIANLVQFLIFFLIFASIAFLAIEHFYIEIFEKHKLVFIIGEHIIVAIFTIEYVLRLATAPQKIKFIRHPLNIVDFLAIAPAYIELFLPIFVNTSGLRIIRLLRLSRILRLLKFFKYGRFFKKIFRWQGTIMQAISHIIILFLFLKGIIWTLEYFNFWIRDASLGELFAIIGFALGIILSQKIASSYDKFLQVEDHVVQIYSTLKSLAIILNEAQAGLGTKACYKWAEKFFSLVKRPETFNADINKNNLELYQDIKKIENTPSEIAILYTDLCRDADFCLSKKNRLTPRAYDSLLQQSTILYLVMIIVFIPGLTGLVSVMIATYILYGMYNLTQDLDSIVGGDFNLIDINMQEFQSLIKNKEV